MNKCLLGLACLVFVGLLAWAALTVAEHGLTADEGKPVGEVFRCTELYKRDFGVWPKDFAEILSRLNGLDKQYFQSLQRQGGLNIDLQCIEQHDGTAIATVTVVSRLGSHFYTRTLNEAGPKDAIGDWEDPFSENPDIRPQFRRSH